MLITVLTWNLERQRPGAWRADAMLERVARAHPAVACFTEAHAGFTAPISGHELAIPGAAWSERKPTERLVMLWSREPWSEVDLIGNDDTRTGAYIAAATTTPLGPVRVVGLCAPHHMAAPIGVTPRPKMWTEQLIFWRGLKAMVAALPRTLPLVIMGDFNTYFPRVWGSKAAHAAALDALHDLQLVTTGLIPDVEAPAIDHLALSSGLTCERIRGLSRFSEDERALSDHFGISAQLRAPAKE